MWQAYGPLCLLTSLVLTSLLSPHFTYKETNNCQETDRHPTLIENHTEWQGQILMISHSQTVALSGKPSKVKRRSVNKKKHFVSYAVFDMH